MQITFDKYDIRLLAALQRNGSATILELAEQVHLSGSQCQRRLKRLEQSQVIERYSALLNREAIGLTVMAIVNVSLNKHNKRPVQEFHDLIENHANIIECWVTMGDYDYSLKVVEVDLKSLTRFMLEDLMASPLIGDISSTILLQQIKRTSDLPLKQLQHL